MPDKLFITLEKSNFWKEGPSKLGFIRKNYLQYLKKLINNNLIKVLTGQRRTGKSYILRQFIDYLINELKIPRKNILYINLELLEFKLIKNEEDLQQLIELYMAQVKPNLKKTFYLFIDEVQEVQGWEKLLNSYLADSNLDVQIFITGSNSTLLASELATYITGRYISKQVYPFSYQEFLSYFNLNNSKEQFLKYLTGSSLPETFILQNRELIRSYLNDLKDSILLKDIVMRHKVHNTDLLEKLFLFLVDNLANLFSINSIVNKLKALGQSTNTNTIASYLKYFQEVYLVAGVDRFDIKGKRILEGEKKYYLNDTGFRTCLFSSYDTAIGKLLENYVHNILVQAGYSVYVGKIGDVEIDFIAEKGNEKKYIQVAYLLYDENVAAREFGNLQQIQDHWEKLVLTLDDVNMGAKEGVKHLQIWQFDENLKTDFLQCE